MTCCGMPLNIVYKTRFSATGHIVTLARLQCNVCGKRTSWRKSVDEAYMNWSEKE